MCAAWLMVPTEVLRTAGGAGPQGGSEAASVETGQQRTSPSPTMQPLEKHESAVLFMYEPNSPRMAGKMCV